MLTVPCRRAAGLSFLQINELAYYLPNCLLAQLTLWGTGGDEHSEEDFSWLSRSAVLYDVTLLLPHASLFCFAWYLDSAPT